MKTASYHKNTEMMKVLCYFGYLLFSLLKYNIVNGLSLSLQPTRRPTARSFPRLCEESDTDNSESDRTVTVKNGFKEEYYSTRSSLLSSDDKSNTPIKSTSVKASHVKYSNWVKYTTLPLLLLLLSFSMPTNIQQNHHYQAVAEEGMTCVAKNCSKELSKCLSNPTCGQGLGCFIGCTTSDIVKNSSSRVAAVDELGKQPKIIEGACQVRCMDLYQNHLLDDFTECSLTKNHCYPCLKADDR